MIQLSGVLAPAVQPPWKSHLVPEEVEPTFGLCGSLAPEIQVDSRRTRRLHIALLALVAVRELVVVDRDTEDCSMAADSQVADSHMGEAVVVQEVAEGTADRCKAVDAVEDDFHVAATEDGSLVVVVGVEEDRWFVDAMNVLRNPNQIPHLLHHSCRLVN